MTFFRSCLDIASVPLPFLYLMVFLMVFSFNFNNRFVEKFFSINCEVSVSTDLIRSSYHLFGCYLCGCHLMC